MKIANMDNHELTKLNYDILTCYRYLDFIKDFLDNINEDVGEEDGENLFVYGYEYDISISHLKNVLNFVFEQQKGVELYK